MEVGQGSAVSIKIDVDPTPGWWDGNVSRKNLLAVVAVLSLSMVCYQRYALFQEDRKIDAVARQEQSDIAAIRKEQAQAMSAILDGQREHARTMNKNINILIGTVKTLTDELIESDKKP